MEQMSRKTVHAYIHRLASAVTDMWTHVGREKVEGNVTR